MFTCPKCKSYLPKSRKIYHEFQECKVGLDSNKNDEELIYLMNLERENSNNYNNDLEYAKKLEKEINGDSYPVGDSTFAKNLQEELNKENLDINTNSIINFNFGDSYINGSSISRIGLNNNNNNNNSINNNNRIPIRNNKNNNNNNNNRFPIRNINNNNRIPIRNNNNNRNQYNNNQNMNNNPLITINNLRDEESIEILRRINQNPQRRIPNQARTNPPIQPSNPSRRIIRLNNSNENEEEENEESESSINSRIIQLEGLGELAMLVAILEILNVKKEHPVTEKLLNELPEIKIQNVNKLENDKKRCNICLEDFSNGEKVLVLPCLHIFHTNCIKEWFKSNNTCPLCKSQITESKIYGPEKEKITPGMSSERINY